MVPKELRLGWRDAASPEGVEVEMGEANGAQQYHQTQQLQVRRLSSSSSCRKKLCACCCCVAVVVGVIGCIAGFGVALPLATRTRFELCGANVTEATTSYLALSVRLAVYNPSFASVHISNAHVAVATGERDAAGIPFEDAATASVSYGALAACDLVDTTLVGGTASPVALECAISQYRSAKATLSELVSAFVDGGNTAPMLSMRYDVSASLMGLPVTTSQTLVINVTSWLPTLREMNSSSAAATGPPLCAAGTSDGAAFDPISILSGGSMSPPATASEALTLVHMCDASLAVAETSGGNITVFSLFLDGDVFNPLGVSAAVREASVALAIQPATPSWQGSPVTSVSPAAGGTVAACSLKRRPPSLQSFTRPPSLSTQPLTFASEEWAPFRIDCGFSAGFADLVARYESGETLPLTAVYAIDASALGITFERSETVDFELSRDEVRAQLGTVQGGGDAPSSYGPSPRLPAGADACTGFAAPYTGPASGSAFAAQLDATQGAVRLVLAEVGVTL